MNSELEDLKQTYPEVSLNINPNQWPVLQASSALENLDLSLAVDKLRATHIMLRGVSLALWVFVGIAMIYASGHSESIISCCVGTIIAIGGSALAARGSRMYIRWTFRYTVELMIAQAIKPAVFVKRVMKDKPRNESCMTNSIDEKSSS